MRALMALALVGGAPAADLALLHRFAAEPSVAELQRAAVRLAELDPARGRSWLARAGKSALLPMVRARLHHGAGELARDGTDRILSTTNESWGWEVAAIWSLDRLIFDRDELYAGREAQLMARRREELVTRVAELYYARRRLQLEAIAGPSAGTGPEAELQTADRALELEELTAVLDGLTGGAMSRRKNER